MDEKQLIQIACGQTGLLIFFLGQQLAIIRLLVFNEGQHAVPLISWAARLQVLPGLSAGNTLQTL